jgi:serine/threonine protein kinase
LDVLDIGIKIASALALVLKHGFLHCDLKPGNILFNADNEPKLVDFGLAKKVGAEHNPDESPLGTPYYVAPEKIKREPETFLSDMYSLGGTLYHALTGHVPFEAPTVKELVVAHVNVPLTPPNQVVAEISQAGSDALAQAMAKRPRDRFQSYEEFIMAMEAARTYLLREKFSEDASKTAKTASGGKWWKSKSA